MLLVIQPLNGLLELPGRTVAAAAHTGALDKVDRLPPHVGQEGALERLGLVRVRVRVRAWVKVRVRLSVRGRARV